ncbi:filamin-A-interacting protein 1-like [Ruditapes philippinarum]|uniref:filamin-A-interacting protein 1-like n=1 Tax=Ruditapes philippinarum TaxID=129788 RepID=UPI00295B367F|nr:filamin-A-interacting protein 1-like [Ruditapes philippinarum]
MEEKVAIEMKMREIGHKLKVKIDEEKQLTCSLESRSALINEAKCISEKLKEEKEALRREKNEFQKLLNERHAEIVTEKEAANDRLSKMRIDYESRLKELSNLSTKVQHDASETEKKLKKKIYGLEQDLKKETEQNKQLKSQVNSLSEKIKDLETEIRNEQEKNAYKESQIETAALQLEDVTKNNEELKFKLVQAAENTRSEMEKSSAKISDLTQDKTSLAKQLRALKDNMQDLQTTLTTQKTTYEAKFSDLMHNMEQLQGKKLETDKMIFALEQGHRELQQLYETTKEELDQFKRIKKMQIQMYYNSRSSLISKVENELKTLLKREIESNTTKLEFIDREKVNDIAPSEPLLIICICASRLSTDASNAVQSLKLTSNMALLVFHHKDGHALPNQASEHVLTGNEYKRLGGIFDFGFLSGKGIYSCEMNDQNFRNIVHFIRKEQRDSGKSKTPDQMLAPAQAKWKESKGKTLNLQEKASHNDMLKGKVDASETRSQCKNDKGEIKNELKDSECLKTKNVKLHKEIKTLQAGKRTKIQSYQETITTETKLHETKILDLKRQLKLVQDDKSETEKTLNSLRQDHKKLQQMYDTIKQEIERFKAIKTVQIQLFHGSKIPLISKVENELTAYLKKEMENVVTKLEFVERESDTDVDPDKTLLIVCINASRLGTDAITAIKTLNVTSKMALLVFHHKDWQCTSKPRPVQHVLTDTSFNVRLGGIFDFGFSARQRHIFV